MANRSSCNQSTKYNLKQNGEGSTVSCFSICRPILFDKYSKPNVVLLKFLKCPLTDRNIIHLVHCQNFLHFSVDIIISHYKLLDFHELVFASNELWIIEYAIFAATGSSRNAVVSGIRFIKIKSHFQAFPPYNLPFSLSYRAMFRYVQLLTKTTMDN